MNLKMSEKLAEKLFNLPYEYLEDPYYLDLKERANAGINNFDVIYSFIISLTSVIQDLVTLFSLVFIISRFDYKIVIVLVLAIVFNILLILLTFKTRIKFFNELIPINRKITVYIEPFVDEKYTKDFINYPIGDLIKFKYIKYEKKIMTYIKKTERKLSIINCLSNIITYMEVALIYILVAIKTIHYKYSISTFSLYVSASISFTKTITDLIECGSSLLRNIQYAEPIVSLMEIKTQNEDKKIELNGQIKTLEFKNVTFKYPRSEEIIIDNLSFKVNEKEKISIVGLNGAGKTTIVKLICGLYNPSKGEILVNGINIKYYDYQSYKKAISAVFQDFKLFAYTIKENILNNDYDTKEKALNAAYSVGLKNKIESLPNGIDSLYTKSYDEGGIELSGGEKQKVAIARALAKDSSLVILDEPTAALDPFAEADIYQNFNDLVHDKTALFISHRMSSSVFCNKILVIENGKLISFDTHKNLMKNPNSLYYKLFMAQAKNYAK